MILKGMVDEDFVNFKLPSMYLIFPHCSFKCDHENGGQYCQNYALSTGREVPIDKETLILRYLENPITKAIVMGGLEPFDSMADVVTFIDCLRRTHNCDDPVVIYTGYTEEEMETGNWGKEGCEGINLNLWESLKSYGNIIVKFGRYRPHQHPHFDEVLGVYLASDNQYGRMI